MDIFSHNLAHVSVAELIRSLWKLY